MTGVGTTKVLVTGWFSFVNGEATAGDLLARGVACEWLESSPGRFAARPRWRRWSPGWTWS